MWVAHQTGGNLSQLMRKRNIYEVGESKTPAKEGVPFFLYRLAWRSGSASPLQLT